MYRRRVPGPWQLLVDYTYGWYDPVALAPSEPQGEDGGCGAGASLLPSIMDIKRWLSVFSVHNQADSTIGTRRIALRTITRLCT